MSWNSTPLRNWSLGITKLIKNLETFESSCRRRMLKIKQMDKTLNEEDEIMKKIVDAK